MARNVAAAVVLSVSVLLTTSAASAQVAVSDYLVLDTMKTSTMQKELQDAADRGYRLVDGQGSWLLSAILEKTTGSTAEPLEYLLLATKKSGTMQKEIDEASSQGYRFLSVLGIGPEVTIVMQRTKGVTVPADEHKLLATSSIKTMQRELLVEAAKGFRFVGQTVFEKSPMLGGNEYVAILQRSVGAATR
jgi:hypothetical protein